MSNFPKTSLFSFALYFAIFFVFPPNKTFSQDSISNQNVPQRELFDYFKSRKKREEADQRTTEKPLAHKTFYGLIPAIASNPTSGFIYGIAGNISRYLGDVDKTRISSVSLVATLTTRNQLFLNARSYVFSPNDTWVLQGDWRYQITNQPTYGLGTGINEDEKSLIIYDFNRFHQTFLRQTAENLYLGIGVHYDRWYNIKDELAEQRLADNNPNLTPYFAYNLRNNFDNLQTTATALSANFVYDSRDNAINSYKGTFFTFNYRSAFQGLGGSSNYGQVYAEARHFIRLHPKKQRILGFWAFTQLITSGKAPYMMLPALGWDTYGGSGRGFPQGRFRGEEMIYLEAEYRQNISRNGLLGFVAFANTTSISSQMNDINFLQNFDVGGGLGLRVKLNKHSLTNIAFDYGIGTQGSSGFFINVTEAF